jgi:hypothetical protein
VRFDDWLTGRDRQFELAVAVREGSPLPLTRLRWLLRAFLAPWGRRWKGLPDVPREELEDAARQLVAEGTERVRVHFTLELEEVTGERRRPLAPTAEWVDLGDLSASDQYGVGLRCERCRVRWRGCAAACECPRCGDTAAWEEHQRLAADPFAGLAP